MKTVTMLAGIVAMALATTLSLSAGDCPAKQTVKCDKKADAKAAPCAKADAKCGTTECPKKADAKTDAKADAKCGTTACPKKAGEAKTDSGKKDAPKAKTGANGEVEEVDVVIEAVEEQ